MDKLVVIVALIGALAGCTEDVRTDCDNITFPGGAVMILGGGHLVPLSSIGDVHYYAGQNMMRVGVIAGLNFWLHGGDCAEVFRKLSIGVSHVPSH